MSAYLLSSKLKRLSTMGTSEMLSRLTQAFSKKIDSFNIARKWLNPSPLISSDESGRFFFTQEELPRRIRLICENIPNFETNLLNQAEKILQHHFPLLGYGNLDYGENIDWQLDIINGKRAPLKPWPTIKYLDFNEVGDHKVPWELSRHQFLPTLAKAWLMTGDEGFIRGLEDIYYDWQRKNPYPLGINWASSLEVAFRSLSWIWVVQLLSGCKSAEKICHDMKQALAFNAWYIRRYLSTYFSPNTHLQGEAVALYFIGTLFPCFKDAEIWRECGWQILLEHAQTKVLEDGAYFEQSTYYHVYALDFFLHARIIAKQNGKPFPCSYDDILKKMLAQLSSLCQAGPPPRFGDDDGGRVFDGRRNEAMHLSDPLVIGTALYSQSDFKVEDLGGTEEMLWLLGEEGLRMFSSYWEPKKCQPIHYEQTGLFITPASKNKRSQAVLDVGLLGGGSGGHGHADALSLVLNLKGQPVLIDPGTCNYMGMGSEREDFRVTSAHNTITVDNFSQTTPKTAFSWHQWPKVIVESVLFQTEFEFIRASHDGYSHLPSPVTHRRTLFASHQGFWFVFDQLVGSSSHKYALQWHLAPDSVLERIGETNWSVRVGNNKLLVLTSGENWQSTGLSGWFSPAYGIKKIAPVLDFTKDSQGNETIATVLWPDNLNSAIPSLIALNHSPDLPIYCLSDGGSRSLFLCGDGVSTLTLEGLESDAEFLYSIFDADRKLTYFLALQSTFVRYYGQPLYESAEKTTSFIWRSTDLP